MCTLLCTYKYTYIIIIIVIVVICIFAMHVCLCVRVYIRIYVLCAHVCNLFVHVFFVRLYTNLELFLFFFFFDFVFFLSACHQNASHNIFDCIAFVVLTHGFESFSKESFPTSKPI